MSNEKSAIEWTDATWNPIVGCSVISAGCTNCYAMRLAHQRLDGRVPHYDGTTAKIKGNPVWTGKVALAPENVLTQPLRWRKPRYIFVNSMGDIFHESVPKEWIDRVFTIMARASQHTFMVLTKRAERMREYISALTKITVETLPNVWLGVSVEDQDTADERIPHLIETPAALRFISAEPLLGMVGIETWLGGNSSLDWVICGGESGPGARPMHPDWPRLLRTQCMGARIPFYFKQWGEWVPGEDKHDDAYFHFQNGTAIECHLIPEEDEESNDGRFVWDCFGPAYDEWEESGADPGYEPPIVVYHRVGKKRAGRRLDGAYWSEFPG